MRADRRDAENRETDEDEFHYESPARAAERVRQFATIKDLLTADTPGTLERLESFASRVASIAIAPQLAAEAIAGARDAPMRSRSSSFDQRRRPETFRTAMAMAFFWPTSTSAQ
jgi:hypothetical protein